MFLFFYLLQIVVFLVLLRMKCNFIHYPTYQSSSSFEVRRGMNTVWRTSQSDGESVLFRFVFIIIFLKSSIMSNPVFYIAPEYLEKQSAPVPSSSSKPNQVAICNPSLCYPTECSNIQRDKGCLNTSLEKTSTVEVISNSTSQVGTYTCQSISQRDGNEYYQTQLQSSSTPILVSVQPIECRNQQQYSGQTIYPPQQYDPVLLPVQQQQQQQQSQQPYYPPPPPYHHQLYPIPLPPYPQQPIHMHNQPSPTPNTSFLPPISKKYLPNHFDQVRCPGCGLVLHTPLGAPQFYCPCGMLLKNPNYKTGYIPPQ